MRRYMYKHSDDKLTVRFWFTLLSNDVDVLRLLFANHDAEKLRDVFERWCVDDWNFQGVIAAYCQCIGNKYRRVIGYGACLIIFNVIRNLATSTGCEVLFAS